MSEKFSSINNKRKNIKISKKKRFNIEDDKKLIFLVEKYHQNWDIIGFLMNRQKRVCKERYYHYLLPKHSSWQWTLEERLQLIYLKSQLKYSWEEINKIFPYRGPKTIKNQWCYLSKKPNVQKLIILYQNNFLKTFKQQNNFHLDNNEYADIFSDFCDSLP